MLLPKQVISLPEMISEMKHDGNSVRVHHLINVFAFFCGILMIVFLPYLHIGMIYHHLWSQYNNKVNRSTCTCSCWDSAFKGIYESGVSNYKHVFINATSNSFKIWALTATAACLLSESTRNMIVLYFSKKLRLNFCILFLLNIYPIYYSWWIYLNYWNDEFYRQWYHQLIFTLTELVSIATSVHLMNVDSPIQPWKLLVIFNIGAAHILVSFVDQFAYNVLRSQGNLNQILRDIGFMIPDLVHVYVPLKEFKILGRKRQMPPAYLVSNKAFTASVCFIVGMWIFGTFSK